MSPNLDTSDPWDWDVDRVVQELCTTNRTWQPLSPAMLTISDPISLEAVLREQEVNGAVILGELNMNILKDDFGIKALGRRSFIMSAVDQFRSRSSKYQSHNMEQHPNPVASELGRSLQEAIGRFQWANVKYPLSQTFGKKGLSLAEIHTVEEPSEAQASKYLPLLASEGHKPSETIIPLTENRSEPNDTSTKSVPKELLTVDKSPEITGKKRKRLAPTLITQSVNPELTRENQALSISSEHTIEADNEIVHQTKIQTHNTVREPGAVYIGSDGLKRMTPLLISSRDPKTLQYQNNSLSENTTSKVNLCSLKESQRLTHAKEFIGRKRMTIDSIFYEGIPVGSEIPNTANQDEFYVGPKNITMGKRLYVNNAMKFFFRSHRYDINDQNNLSVRIPYSSKLVPRSREQSFTVYQYKGHGKVVARRGAKIDTSSQTVQSAGGERSAIFNPQNRNILEFVGSNTGLDPSLLLEKYKYLEGGDEILPPYGESDEENEFDEATWKEIENEFGTRSRPEQKLKRPPISEVEVMQAFEAGIVDLVSKWKLKNKSKRESKAWRLWIKSRRLRNKKEQIIAAKRDLSHAQEYLEKMQNRILSDVWTSQSQVRKQMGSIEATVFNREDLNWRISVLKQKMPPEKPSEVTSTSRVKKPSLQVKGDDDGEPISSSEDKSSDCDDLDDLDDFIVDDDCIASENEELHELDLVGSEKDDITQSDSSASDDFIPLGSNKSRSEKKSDSNLNEKTPFSAARQNKSLWSSKPDRKVPELIDVDKSPPSRNCSTPLAKVMTVSSTDSVHSSKNQYVDLTISSSEDDNTLKRSNRSAVGRVLNERSSPKSKQKRTKTPDTFQPTSSHVSSRVSQVGDEQMSTSKKKKSNLFKDPDATAEHSYDILRKLADRERLLIKYFYYLESGLRLEVIKFFATLSEEELWSELLKVIEMITIKGLDLSKIEEKKIAQLIQILCVFEMFIDCRYHSDKNYPDDNRLKKLQEARPEHFQSFYQICYNMAQKFKGGLQKSQPAEPVSCSELTLGDEKDDGDDDDDDEPPKSAIKRRRTKFVSISDEEAAGEKMPHGKRKKLVHENKEARDIREQNLRRLAQQDERRKKLHASLTKANDSNSIVRSQLIINDAAAEGQKLIYVNDHIAKRIKKHQVEGVRFMWNQIVTIADEKSMQGCLLAHTMGLGKTMQTITLLVAIAEASRSDDPFVSSQIPESLRASRTLILCPPSLVNNWMDELLVWVPDDILGELRKVDSSIKSLPEKVQTIMDWRTEGGVLVIGYEIFRDLINYKNKKISNSEHEKVSKDLLEGPNIIIADEAHRMKNTKAAITIAASKFRSKSRIALTGSPLANNVEEYHTMIEWVAPNYLGPIVEFRAKYVEPIQAGNYQNSTAYERRKSLKMLGVLSADLAPKVHRADMSVMKNELPPKKEFVITVPLTDIQKKAYSIFVKSMMEGNNYTTTKSGDVTSTTVWHWLAVLSLLCNHPECFRRKLLKRKEEAKHEESNSLNTTDNDEAVIDLNAPVWKVGVSQELVDAENKIFETKKSLDSIQMSNKVLLLCQILDACKSVGDKALVFSQSIPTLDFLEDVFKRKNRNYARLDGSTAMSRRQGQTKDFNTGNTDIYLISTAAGGLGLNLQGANRVVIFDFKFNPIMEEQAVGRAYRIGQKKPTFIYRFIAGGTFEDSVHNKTVFKTQLASRVVDKKNPIAWANKKTSEFLFEPKDVPQKDLSEFEGMDPSVLDRLLQSQKRKDQQGNPRTICSIVQTDTFAVDDDDKLTPDEEREVQSELEKTRLFRANPQAYQLHQSNEQQSFRQHILSEQQLFRQHIFTQHPAFVGTISLSQNASSPSALTSITNYSNDLLQLSASSVYETPNSEPVMVPLQQIAASPALLSPVMRQNEESPKVPSAVRTSSENQTKVSLPQPPEFSAMIPSMTNQSTESQKQLVLSDSGTPNFNQNKKLPLQSPNPPALVPPAITQGKNQHGSIVSPSPHGSRYNINQNNEISQIAPETHPVKASLAPPLVSRPKAPSSGDGLARNSSATKTIDLESSKDSSFLTKTPSSKPRSPVAGANTKKVSMSTLEPSIKSSSTSLTHNTQPSISNPNPKAPNLDKGKLLESKDSSKPKSTVSAKDSSTSVSGNVTPKIAHDVTTSKDSISKSLPKSGKEWDISKRYRESKASNVPDYGPLAASSTLKQTEQETPKNFLIKATAKNPRIIPFSPSQKKDGNNTHISTSSAKEALDIAQRPRICGKSGPPLKIPPNSVKQTRENSSSLQRRFSSPSSSFRRPSVPLPPKPAPAYRRPLPPVYQRPSPLSPPPSYVPTGPRLSTTRKIPPWEENDSDRSQSYRGQSYRPPPSPYHYPPSARR
ncbi:hypothetical protein K3495_g3760 [Podosphaera aphanis]|nr:hypothetical protein K3495_g3760 [Podosphaera aphanis]